MVDLSKLAFLSLENYMKREDRGVRFQDVTVGAFGDEEIDINHNLNRIPEYQVSGELLADGMIWSGTLPYVGMTTSSGGATPASGVLNSWTTLNTLTLHVANPTASSKTYRLYYIIYRDYA